jgi:phosphoribosyl 1,2-cyclic phosphate phosphodiesterase
MKLTFLGTGTSMGVPVAGGFGANRFSKDPRNTRTRCSAWIQTKDTSILIDAGPEFRIQSIRSRIKRIDGVLITHEHMDHVSGLDDLRAYNYVQESSIPLYTSASCIDSIRSRFDYLFGENKYLGSTSLDLIEVSKTFYLNDLEITPLPCFHGDLDILGFKINDLCYLTDVKEIPESTKELIRGSKVIVISGLRWEPHHPTHLTIPQAADLINELEVPRGYLIHMNSYVDHEPSNKKLPDNINLAYDQQVIEVD